MGCRCSGLTSYQAALTRKVWTFELVLGFLPIAAIMLVLFLFIGVDRIVITGIGMVPLIEMSIVRVDLRFLRQRPRLPKNLAVGSSIRLLKRFTIFAC